VRSIDRTWWISLWRCAIVPSIAENANKINAKERRSSSIFLLDHATSSYSRNARSLPRRQSPDFFRDDGCSFALYSNVIKNEREAFVAKTHVNERTTSRRQGIRAFVRVPLRMQSTIRLCVIVPAVNVIVTVNRDCLRFLLAESICLSRFITIAEARAVSHVASVLRLIS